MDYTMTLQKSWIKTLNESQRRHDENKTELHFSKWGKNKNFAALYKPVDDIFFHF